MKIGPRGTRPDAVQPPQFPTRMRHPGLRRLANESAIPKHILARPRTACLRCGASHPSTTALANPCVPGPKRNARFRVRLDAFAVPSANAHFLRIVDDQRYEFGRQQRVELAVPWKASVGQVSDLNR